AVELHEEDSIDRVAVDSVVRAELVDQLLAVDRYPDAPVGAVAAMREHLELEPLPDRHRDGLDLCPPERLVRETAVGDVVRVELPVGRDAAVVHDLSVDPVVAGALPLEYDVPAVDQLIQQARV